MGNYYAHTTGLGLETWEPLEKHLADVAWLAEEFAGAFDAGSWGAVLGQWHDLGKYAAAFQAYLRRTSDPDASEETSGSGRVDHSTFGARHATASLETLAGQLLAFCIAGHHAGLADATPLSEPTALAFRLDPDKRDIPPVTLPANIPAAPALTLPWRKHPLPAETGFAIAFFARMLFSCLIDADRTATEAFCNSAQSALRRRPKPTLEQLRIALDDYLETKQKESPPTHVNRLRAGVLSDCLKAANLPPGFFSLNVPTGGGKTFASLAFALHQAKHHADLRRVVVVIPFTSIIEQTADQYRKAFGPLSETGLVEHHSNLNPKRDTLQNKLATENWDAPLIVTTNVQLYESLFASKTTPARKLHRLANSVIILDEAQTIPIDLLAPTLAALKELVARYGCSVVLCTATQPALERREKEFEIGIENVRPIVGDVDTLHGALRRVSVQRLGKIDDVALADRLASERQVLCIVNTKAHAANLFERLAAISDETACFHLSTFMCPQHRRDVLAQIRKRLEDKLPCRVISTQLIEAGVDVDFPSVYRAAAGFDSIAQAAGRCNREGKLVDAAGNPMLGRVYVFDADIPPPAGLLRSAADVAGEIADDYPDPIVPGAIRHYFGLLYWNRKGVHGWDPHGVLPCFEYDRNVDRNFAPFKFKTAALAYQLIREEQTSVLVPYDKKSRAMIDHLMTGAPVDYDFYKAAQQYSVGVRDQLLQKLAGENMNVLPHEDSGLWYLANPDAYSRKTGLLANVAGIDPESLMS